MSREPRESETDGIVGVSKHISELRQTIKRAAEREDTVLIEGETGTGKELIAKAIHANSPRKGGPLEIVNCAAIPGDLFESELFGHEKGAFTGATEKKKGSVSLAEGGTLFLDEVADLKPAHQPSILRFLQEKSYRPVGGKRTQETNVRIIAATNKELNREIKEGHFRQDLYYRLKQRIIKTLPLAARPEDLVCLVNHFIIRDGLQVEPKSKFLLYSYYFPGNVRELITLLTQDYDYVKSELLKECSSETGNDPEKLKGFSYDGKTVTPHYFDHWPRPEPHEEIWDAVSQTLGYSQSGKAMRLHRLINAIVSVEDDAIDFRKCVEAFEIITLYQKAGLSQRQISDTLHIRHDKITKDSFQRRFGYPFPADRNYYIVGCPMDVHPRPRTPKQVYSDHGIVFPASE